MNVDFEPVMAALFAHLQQAVTVTFSATVKINSAVLTNVSNFAGLFVGLPAFGPGIPIDTVIQEMTPGAGTVTLSDLPTAAGTAVSFSTGFLTTGRRVPHWGQVSAQPALFLRRTGVIDEAAETFIITTLECEAWIYCNAGLDPDIAPDSVLTCLEQMLRASFAPDGDYGDVRFTLGGLVYWCRIEGKSDISPGDQGAQAIARIPIRITLP